MSGDVKLFLHTTGKSKVLVTLSLLSNDLVQRHVSIWVSLTLTFNITASLLLRLK
jgi:hypothetical protein